jgi:anti-sigma regulatory factor (Ser/Thr protein kinase)
MSDDEREPESHRTADWRLAGEADAAALAREYLKDFLSGDAGCEPPARDALIAVSELVTNAVIHAPGPISLSVRDDGRELQIAVGDTSTAEPRLRDPDLIDGNGGLGLRILAAMGIHLDVRPGDEGGKVVSVVLPSPRVSAS